MNTVEPGAYQGEFRWRNARATYHACHKRGISILELHYMMGQFPSAQDLADGHIWPERIAPFLDMDPEDIWDLGKP